MGLGEIVGPNVFVVELLEALRRPLCQKLRAGFECGICLELGEILTNTKAVA